MIINEFIIIIIIGHFEKRQTMPNKNKQNAITIII